MFSDGTRYDNNTVAGPVKGYNDVVWNECTRFGFRSGFAVYDTPCEDEVYAHICKLEAFKGIYPRPSHASKMSEMELLLLVKRRSSISEILFS